MSFVKNDDNKWTLFFNGSNGTHGVRVGIILISSNDGGIPITYKFSTMDNKEFTKPMNIMHLKRYDG